MADSLNWTGSNIAQDRYQVKKRLGAGGMGFVYLAFDQQTGQEVVIKVPRPAMLEDPDFAGRFTREVKALFRLVHPHIAKVLEVGEHEGKPFVVLEYLPGGSLRDRLASGPRSPAELRSWLGGVASALDFCHQNQCIHRDVKPDNILFDAQGKPYLSDFGIAKVMSVSPRTRVTVLTASGLVLGTPQYMAPELIMAEKFDGRVDQYSLAVTLYEVLTGKTPFQGTNPAAIIVQQTTKEVPPLSSLLPSIPRTFSQELAKALSKDPKDRFPNCTALAKALLTSLQSKAAVPGSGAMAKPAATVATRKMATFPCPKCKVPVEVNLPLTDPNLQCRACSHKFRLREPSKTPQRPQSAPTKKAEAPRSRRSFGKRLLVLSLVLILLAGVGFVSLPFLPFEFFRETPIAANATDTKIPEREEIPTPLPEEVPPPPMPEVVPQPPMPPEPVKPIPKLVLKADTQVNLRAGDSKALQVFVERVDCQGPIKISLEGLPNYVTSTPIVLRESDTSGWIFITAQGEAQGQARIQVKAVLEEVQAQHAVDLALEKLEIAKEIRQLPGHTGDLRALAFTPDGRMMASTSLDHTIRVWDPTSWKELKKMNGGSTKVLFSRDGGTLISCGSNKAASLWNPLTGVELGVFPNHGYEVETAAISPNGTFLVTSSWDNTVRLWNVRTQKEIRRFQGSTECTWTLDFSPDGTHVLGGSGGIVKEVFNSKKENIGYKNHAGTDNHVRLWEVATGKEVLRMQGHTSGVQFVQFLPGVNKAVSASLDGSIRTWDLASGKEAGIIRNSTAGFWSAALFPGAKRILTGCSDRTIRIWDLEGGVELQRFLAHIDPIWSVAISPDGLTGVSGCTGGWNDKAYIPSKDNNIRVWELPRGLKN